MTALAPWLYRISQRVTAPGAEHRLREMLRLWLAGHPPLGRCLDVGCGPDSWLRLVGVKPEGVDADNCRVAAFARRNGRAVCASAMRLPFAGGEFDSVWSFGLLHHLSDEDARLTVKEMRRVTRPGGCLVVFDGVLPDAPWKHPLAAALRRMDCGHWMRSQAALEKLLAPSGDWERRRLTYALTGLEGLLCTLRA